MFNLGGAEILVILVVALLVLGPDKLPNVMRKVGKAVGELRRASTEFQRTMHVAIEEDSTPSSPGSSHSGSSPSDSSMTASSPDAVPAEEASSLTEAAENRRKRSLPRAARSRRLHSAHREKTAETPGGDQA